MPKPLKVIVSGGGTGGHVFPAIAIANALKKEVPNAEFLFVGAKGRIEMEKVPKAGYPIKGLWISGFHRKITLRNLMFPFKLGHSLTKSFFIVRKFKPDVAIGVGGYASGPLLQAATMMGVPALIQEQNAFPGVTNRILSKRVQKICVAYDGMDKFFEQQKIVNLGNPVRDAIIHIKGTKEEALKHFGLDPNKKVVFITGGSLGARGVNNAIIHHLKNFHDQGIQLIWQAGKIYIEEAREKAAPYADSIKALDFIDRMDLAYIAADLIISRAGGTISELCIIGKPTILMPSPNVAEDHQTSNAKSLVEKEAALMVKDDEAKAQLFDAVQEVLKDENRMNRLAKNIKALARTDSAEKIAKEVLKLVKN